MSAIRLLVACVHVHDQLTAQFPRLRFGVGRKYLKKNARPPRVTWIPVGGPIEATDDVGGREFVSSSGVSQKVDQVATRAQEFEVHVQGCDIDQTEDLLDVIIAAAKGTLSAGGVRFAGTVWTTQSAEGADIAVDGEKVILDLQMRIPVRRELANQLSEVLNVSHSVFFGGGFWGVGSWQQSRTWGIPEQVC